MCTEAPHYNNSLIGSTLQSGIREVFYLCTLENTRRDEACFVRAGSTGVIVELNSQN